MNNRSNDLMASYTAALEEATQGDAGLAVSRFEDLVKRARQAGDHELVARCLSDLSALISAIDPVVSHQLLTSAAEMGTKDPTIYENLAALELREGRASECAASCATAVELALESEMIGAAASALDVWRRAGGNPEAGEFRHALGQFLRLARDTFPPLASSTPDHGDVLLVGDAHQDAALLRARAEQVLRRGERPVGIHLSHEDCPQIPGLEWQTVEAQDLQDFPLDVSAGVSHRSLLRVEIVANSDECLWTLVALATGQAVAVQEGSLPAQEGWPVWPAAPSREVALSVVIPCGGRPETLNRLLESLQDQTLACADYEIIVVDDGASPALSSQLPESCLRGVTLIEQPPAGLGAARNRGLKAARGPLVLFLNADSIAAPDLLEKHLQGHSGSSSNQALIGGFEPAAENRSVVPEMLQRAGLLHIQATAEANLPAHSFRASNVSVPKELVTRAGGFDESRRSCEDIELGLRLAGLGVRLCYRPDLRCEQLHPASIDSFADQCRWMGHEWVDIARKHGPEAWPLFDEPLGLGEASATALEAFLLNEDAEVRDVLQTLQRSQRDVDELLRAHPQLRAEIFEQVEADFVMLLETVFSHEVKRGMVGGLRGWAPDEWSQAQGTRAACVYLVRGPADTRIVRELLQSLPPAVECIAVQMSDAGELDLPVDPRLKRIELPCDQGPAVLRDPLLAHSQAEMFVILDGTRIPQAHEWEELCQTVTALPHLGAVGLASTTHGPRASICQESEMPTAAVACRRCVLAEEGEQASDTFLERLQKGGRKLAWVAPRESGGASRQRTPTECAVVG